MYIIKNISHDHISTIIYLYTVVLLSSIFYILFEFVNLQGYLSANSLTRIAVALGIILPPALYAMRLNGNEMIIFLFKSGKIISAREKKRDIIEGALILFIFLVLYLMSYQYIIQFVKKFVSIEIFANEQADIFVWVGIMVAPAAYFSLRALRIIKSTNAGISG